MDSGLNPGQVSPESIPNVEFSPDSLNNSVEQAPFSSGERYEQKAEAQPTDTSSQPAPLMPPQAPPVVAQPVTADDPTVLPQDNTPATARDSDQIEKEWVLKAKQILSETRDDPHLRDERVKALQADYLEKRYNRKIGDENQ